MVSTEKELAVKSYNVIIFKYTSKVRGSMYFHIALLFVMGFFKSSKLTFALPFKVLVKKRRERYLLGYQKALLVLSISNQGISVKYLIIIFQR